MFAPALEKYTMSLLDRIASDYNLPIAELVAKYTSCPVPVPTEPKVPKAPKARAPRVPKVPVEQRPICPSLTGKKTPCKNRCLSGSDKCHLHSATLPTGEPKPPKVPRVPKAKKVKDQPSHNHAPLIAPDAPCQLCESHGDTTSPDLPLAEFESRQNGMTLQDRLRMIISMGEDADPEPELVESPGAIRHRLLLAERGQVPTYDEEEEEDGEMTEDDDGFGEEDLID